MNENKNNQDTTKPENWDSFYKIKNIFSQKNTLNQYHMQL